MNTGREAGGGSRLKTAIVVGAGPNGLAAAVTLAKAGLQVTVLEAADEIGGGTRTSEAIVPGLLHDHCSAVHPMAVGSQFLGGLGLDRHGLSWRLPEIDCVHPLDDGSAGVLHRSVQATADGLGPDGFKWRRLFCRTSATFDDLAEDMMRPLLRSPRHPLLLARFGAPTGLPASTLARWFRTPQAQALFGGVAAHAFRPLHYPMTSAIGLGILTAGHRHGWAVAAGGSQSITNAMASLLGELGGKIETGTRIEAASQLPPADVTMFDLAPDAVAGILGDRLPRRVARAYQRFRQGPGAFKVDFAVEGGVPWTNPHARRAGTVHLAGTFAELAATERDIHGGRMPERPFVLLGQQYLADPQRSVGNIHPVWTYAHVPNGFSGDATASIITQIERFAPGFRERIVGQAVRTTTQMAAYNPNYVGGDIMTGSKDIRQLTFGPRITLSPYRIGVPGMYICSAATPPGPGAHGMCGANAAQTALKELGRRLPETRHSNWRCKP
jgi:phytoene dehydrogenase-like protein